MKALITLLIVVVLWSNVLGKSTSNNAIQNKIKLLNSKIENYKYRAKNPQTSANRRSKDNIKGWIDKKSADFFNPTVKPINTLPKKYKKKDVKIVYYTKAEQKVYLKKKYLAMVQKLEKEKAALLHSSNVSETKKPKAKKKMIPFAKQLIITDMKREIKLLDNKIKDYKQRSINPTSIGSLRSKDNRKGWKSKGRHSIVMPMSKLPRGYKRKNYRIVYYTRKERKVYLKAKYLAIAEEAQVEKDTLVKELARVVGK